MYSAENYRRPKNQEYVLLENELPFVYSFLTFIQTYLLNKEIHISTSSREIVFLLEKRNVLHLLGISYDGGSSHFWSDFKRKRISISKCSVKKDGTTFQKLPALHGFEEIFTKRSFLVGSGKYERLVFDSALRTNKRILALTLVYSEVKKAYFPNSALNLRSKILPGGERIESICTIDKASKKYYLLKA